MRLSEITDPLTFQDEYRGYHHGQSDQTLRAYVGKRCVGYINYSVFDGEPHVQMIHVEPGNRRKGYGSAMVRRLQSMFPDIEINMGGLTDDGSKLLSSMPQRTVHSSDHKEKHDRLMALKAKEAEYTRIADAWYADPTPAGRKALDAAMVDWNEMNDEIWELEQELRSMRPSRRLFSP